MLRCEIDKCMEEWWSSAPGVVGVVEGLSYGEDWPAKTPPSPE